MMNTISIEAAQAQVELAYALAEQGVVNAELAYTLTKPCLKNEETPEIIPLLLIEAESIIESFVVYGNTALLDKEMNLGIKEVLQELT